MKFFNDTIIPKYWFIVVFGLKLIAGITLTMLYTYYYTDRSTADIFKYFDDSKVMFNALKTHPTDYFKMLFGINNDTSYFNVTYYDQMRFWYSEYPTNIFSDSHIIIRFNAFVQLFSFGHFQVHNVFINFISLLGLTAIYKTAVHFLRTNHKLLFYFIFLAPSVVFWGSGLLKESIIFFGIGMILYHSYQLTKKVGWKSIVMWFIGLILICYSKMYIIAAFIPAFLGVIFHQKIIKRNVWLAYLSGFLFVLITCFILAMAPLKVNPFQLIIAKQHDFISLLNEVPGNSTFNTPLLENTTDIFVQLPMALATTFLRPFLWEINSPLIFMSAAENLDLIFLILFAIYFRKTSPNMGIILFCLSFVISLYLIIGLTVPNFGAIARYKVPAIPFLLIAIAFIIDIEKLKIKYPFLNRIL